MKTRFLKIIFDDKQLIKQVHLPQNRDNIRLFSPTYFAMPKIQF